MGINRGAIALAANSSCSAEECGKWFIFELCGNSRWNLKLAVFGGSGSELYWD